MNKAEKVSYVPSQTKRFEISNDPISRERLAALTAMIKELRNKHPFVVGAILFGSLSKGKRLDENIADKSDIDFIIYLDADALIANFSDFEKERDSKRYKEMEEIDEELHEHYDPRTKEQKTLELAGWYINDLAEKTFAANLPGNRQSPKGIGFLAKPISLTGDYSIHETFKRTFRSHNLEYFASRTDNNLEPLHYSDVALPWGLDVGGGLVEYRKAYLTQLRELSKEERDLEWRVTTRIIKFYERQGDIPEGFKAQYPETFDEALRYYGIKAPSIQTSET